VEEVRLDAATELPTFVEEVCLVDTPEVLNEALLEGEKAALSVDHLPNLSGLFHSLSLALEDQDLFKPWPEPVSLNVFAPLPTAPGKDRLRVRPGPIFPKLTAFPPKP
jgi:hypothetical protein